MFDRNFGKILELVMYIWNLSLERLQLNLGNGWERIKGENGQKDQKNRVFC